MSVEERYQLKLIRIARQVSRVFGLISYASKTVFDARMIEEGRLGGMYMALLEVTNVKKIYSTRFGGNKVQALSNVTFAVEEGEFVAIMGESGSGKTTLLNILAALDRPTEGEVMLEGRNIVHLTEKEISAFRRRIWGLCSRILTFWIPSV